MAETKAVDTAAHELQDEDLTSGDYYFNSYSHFGTHSERCPTPAQFGLSFFPAVCTCPLVLAPSFLMVKLFLFMSVGIHEVCSMDDSLSAAAQCF